MGLNGMKSFSKFVEIYGVKCLLQGEKSRTKIDSVNLRAGKELLPREAVFPHSYLFDMSQIQERTNSDQQTNLLVLSSP